MSLKDIEDEAWLESFQVCRDIVLAGGSTKSVAPDVRDARSYFLTDGTVIVSLKAVTRLACNLARVNFKELGGENQSKFVSNYLKATEFFKSSGIKVLHNKLGKYKEGRSESDHGLGWDTPKGGYSYGSYKHRKNQSKFKMLLLQRYSTCIVSGCRVMALLHACHIDPYSETQDHSIENGIFLRVDLHRMFDLGLLAYDSRSRTWKIYKEVRNGYDQYDEAASQYELSDATVARLDRHFRNSAFAGN